MSVFDHMQFNPENYEPDVKPTMRRNTKPKPLTEKECLAFLETKRAAVAPRSDYTASDYQWCCTVTWNGQPRYFFGATPKAAITEAQCKLAEWEN